MGQNCPACVSNHSTPPISVGDNEQFHGRYAGNRANTPAVAVVLVGRDDNIPPSFSFPVVASSGWPLVHPVGRSSCCLPSMEYGRPFRVPSPGVHWFTPSSDAATTSSAPSLMNSHEPGVSLCRPSACPHEPPSLTVARLP